jgi:circadian clock protein KaiC
LADSRATSETARAKTGVAGLDELLGGGLLPGRSALLKGPPGSGKTTLGLQMLVAGAVEFNEPGVLITFEQMPAQLYADTASFGWDLPGLVEKELLHVMFVRPQEVLQEPGRQENQLLTRIEDWAEDHQARRVLIDSISHLRPLYTGENTRAMFLNFVLKLKAMGLTPIMISEDSSGDDSDLDAYMVDAVINVHYSPGGPGQSARRSVTVAKTRGYGHLGGAHPLEIGAKGIEVYPHSYPAQSECDLPGEPLPTGVAGLDPLLDGGFRPGSNILVAGLSGTFKTSLAGHFLMAGVERGEPGLWVTMQESAADLARSFGRIGMDLNAAREKKLLSFLDITPGVDPLEKTIRRAEELIEANGVKRVVIDSMSDLTLGIEEMGVCEEAALWSGKRLRARGVTSLFTHRLSRAPGRNPLSEIDSAELADTIIYLGLVEIESRLEKVVSVLKHRGAKAEGDLRAIQFGEQGLSVSNRFEGLSGVLGGAALGQRKAQIENVYQPLYFIRDFLKIAKDPKLAPEKREQILGNLSDQTDKLIALLGKYFDEPDKKEK